jgi:pimeloyl-ACP methyl ester carboxylesterase/DNA-binding winged helix-turn-helix (wHTH) protein
VAANRSPLENPQRADEDDMVTTVEQVAGGGDTMARLNPPSGTLDGSARGNGLTAMALIRFADCELDVAAHEVRRDGRPCPVEPQVFDLLVYLARNPGRLVSKDELIAEVWGGRIVSDAALSSRIKSARRAIGDDGEQQRFIRTVHGRGFRFVGTFLAGPVGAEPSKILRQEIQFCHAADGVRIAYSRIGQGPTLVKTGNWLTHLEYDLESPIWRHLWRDLARERTLVRYDARGNGLSDWNVDELSFDAFVSDLESVVDASGVDRFDLFGISQGCAISVAYSARHPDRVRRLVLYGGYAVGCAKRNRTEQERHDAMLTLVRLGWGQENPASRQLFTSQFLPGGTKEQEAWFNNLQRVTVSPYNAARYVAAVGAFDVSDLVSQVRTPTLVMHARDDGRVPFDAGRELAAGIPGARFVPLQSRNHLILEEEPAYARFLAEMRAFLDSPADGSA